MNASTLRALSFPFATPPGPGEAIEVAPGIFWLRMPLPFALDHINLWLLADGDGWTQIDCGYGDVATRTLWATHFAETFAGRHSLRIIATHYHPDHLGNAAWLTKRFDCPLIMPQAEFLTAHAVAGEHSGYHLAAFIELFRAHGLSSEHAAALEARGNQYRRGVPELPRVYQRLMPGADISIGDTHWRIFNGYGHSPEHAALYCQSLRVCISGDMLLPKISTNISVGPVEPDADPLARFLASLSSFAQLPPETLILPSHGLPFVGAAMRVEELRAHHSARLTELEAAAGSSVTAAEMVPVLFRRELDVQQRFFAMGEAIAHLNHLWRVGRMTRTAKSDGTFRFAGARPLQ